MPIAKSSVPLETQIVEIAKVDSKRRITLPQRRLAQYYAIEVTSTEEIILRPRALVDPREMISQKTLSVLDQSMMHLKEGKVGEPIDLSIFEERSQNEQKKSRSKKNKKR